ncbi:MAG: sugar transferase [Candidatus Yanofskybacteria bacterium]|nr:sugar transferase [Candidatus Yanofskybacteria bacterium]
MKKADLFFNVLRLPTDFLMLLAAGATTYIFRTEILRTFRPVLFEFNLPFVKYLYLVIFVSVLFIISYAISGLYLMKTRMGIAEEFSKILVSSSAAVMVIIVYIFLRQELFNSRFLVLGGWFFAILFVFLGRMLVRYLQVFFVAKHDFGIHKIMIIGNDRIAVGIIDDITKNPSSGYRIVKHLLNPEIEEVRHSIKNPGVDEVILANQDYPANKIVELIDFCNEHHLIFKFVPNLNQTLTANYEVDVISGMPLIELKRTALDGWGKVIKRVLDVFAGSLGLIIFSPLIGIIAFAIKWDTEGPVFARLKRISKNKKFNLLKFRGMIKNAEELKPYLTVFNERRDGPLFKIKNDPRITGVGHFIRKYRLDEIPQFWNILKGDMSLVGPRPHQPDEIEKYQKHHKRVLAIKAGATGLAQVSGSSDLPFDKEVAIDTFYIENWSLWLDFKIIIKTLVKVFTDHSAV